MALAIKNNIMATNAARHLGTAYDNLSKSVERLSSGLRINSAKDDAAGLAVRELIRADIAVLQQGSRNAQDGISMMQTMEAAMAVMDENLVRMKELAEQAATGSYSSAQRSIMDAEFSEMADEIERIANSTDFNNIHMLNETANADGSNDVKIHVGTTTTIDVEKSNMTKSGLGIDTGDGGWQLDTAVATAVSSSTAAFLTVSDSSDAQATGTVSLVLDFNTTSSIAGADETAITASFTAGTAAAGTTYSLAQVAAQINTASNALGYDASGTDLNYSAAEIHYDSSSSSYQLRLSSRETNADSLSLLVDSSTGTNTSTAFVSGGFVVTLVGIAAGTTYSTSAEYSSVAVGASSGATQAGLNIKTVDAALTALDTLETAINTKDEARAAFGYKMNRLESTVDILDIQSENLQSAESRISDVDVATEMANLTSTQVLSQAGVAMLAQANSMPQMALTLLR